MTPSTGATLRKLHEDLYAWLPPRRGWGLANCGLLVGRDTALWIDTPYDRARAGEFLASSRELLPAGVEIDRVVVTHGNGDHFWGSGVVPKAELIAAKESLEQAHAEPDPKDLDAFVRGLDPDTVFGAYMRRHFGVFDWSDTDRVRPTTLFRGELELRVGDYPVQVVGLPPAHTTGDLFVHLPHHKTVFSGDVIFASTPEQPGDHPVHWAGPLSAVSAVCERILATGAETIVPGHGPVVGRAGVQAQLDYLEYLRERAEELHGMGVPSLEAARRVIAEGRYPELALPERLVITMRTEYRHLSPGVRPSVLEVMEDVARVAAEREGSDDPAPKATS